MDDSPTGAERVSGRASRSADQNAIADSLCQEVIIDINVNDGQMRLATAVQQQLVDGVKGRRNLDRRLPARYAQRSLLLGTQGKQTQSLVGLGGGSGHELAVDVLAFLVVDANLETVSQEDLRLCRVACRAAAVDTSPSIPKLGKFPLPKKS